MAARFTCTTRTHMDINDIKKEWNATIMGVFKAFIGLCERHGLTYYCCAGTAIGAVRHHGIIPWDDDIDVIMPRPDYDRLLEIGQHADLGDYELITPYGNPAYPLYFSKLADKRTTLVEDSHIPCVTGLYIDIFPLDATDDDVEEAKRLKRKYTKIINRLNAISTHNSFFEYISLLAKPAEWGRFAVKTAAFFARRRLRRALIGQMDAISHKYGYASARNVQVYTGSYGMREVFPKEWLGKGAAFTFEGVTVRLPEQYDTYLRHFFGDYMQLPPVEQRTGKHSRFYINLSRRETMAEVRTKVKTR